MTSKFLSLVSLAQSAGKIASGEQGVEISIRKHNAYLVIIASDASDNTKKKFTNRAKYRKVPICIGFTKKELGNQIGKSPRSVLSVEDKGFAKGMVDRLEDIDTVKLLEVDICQE